MSYAAVLNASPLVNLTRLCINLTAAKIQNNEERVIDQLVKVANRYLSHTDTDWELLWPHIPNALKLAVQKEMMSKGVHDGSFWHTFTGKFPAPPIPQDSAFSVYQNNPYIVSSNKMTTSSVMNMVDVKQQEIKAEIKHGQLYVNDVGPVSKLLYGNNVNFKWQLHFKMQDLRTTPAKDFEVPAVTGERLLSFLKDNWTQQQIENIDMPHEVMAW